MLKILKAPAVKNSILKRKHRKTGRTQGISLIESSGYREALEPHGPRMAVATAYTAPTTVATPATPTSTTIRPALLQNEPIESAIDLLCYTDSLEKSTSQPLLEPLTTAHYRNPMTFAHEEKSLYKQPASPIIAIDLDRLDQRESIDPIDRTLLVASRNTMIPPSIQKQKLFSLQTSYPFRSRPKPSFHPAPPLSSRPLNPPKSGVCPSCKTKLYDPTRAITYPKGPYAIFRVKDMEKVVLKCDYSVPVVRQRKVECGGCGFLIGSEWGGRVYLS